MAVQTTASSTADRELVISRVFDAPRDLVFKVWTDPKHVPHWWGPKGFSTTTHSMDVRPGGAWRYCMHGPDGRDYENLITYREVVKPERLVYKQGGGDKDCEPVNFEVTVTFEDVGGKTRLTSRAVFPTPEALEHVVKTYGVREGAKQHFDNLGEYLATVANPSTDGEQADSPFVVTRVFRAPRDLVFAAWTEREHLMKWFGPKGCQLFSATNDPRPGGVFHYGMRGPDGKEVWGKWTYKEIVKPEKLVVVVSFSDAKGGVTRHPMAADWPLETLSTTTFSDHAGMGRGTVVTLKWSAYNPTEAERKMFNSSHASMQQGWGGTMDQFDDYLRSLEPKS